MGEAESDGEGDHDKIAKIFAYVGDQPGVPRRKYITPTSAHPLHNLHLLRLILSVLS